MIPDGRNLIKERLGPIFCEIFDRILPMSLLKTRIVRLNLYIGIMLLTGAAVCLAVGLPFMRTWFYSFAWWSFILALDGLNHRRCGTSVFFASVPEFLFTAFISVPAWLIFELFNLRLKNWSYLSFPSGLAIRWAGYFIAFASVIPALKELALFFHNFFKRKIRLFGPLRVTPALLNISLGIGILILLLPLIFPRLFFPLVWLGFIFLLEPLNYRRQRPSLLKDLETGGTTRLLSWMSAGLAAGIVWELFNFWAGAHWEYHISYLDFGRIFKMPLFGYGGFVPFALEIWAIDVFLRSFYGSVRQKIVLKLAFWIGLFAFDLMGFYLIDRITVVW